MQTQTNQNQNQKEDVLLPCDQDRLRELKNAFSAVNPKVQRAFTKYLMD
jgi:hypothetical protein